MSQKISKWSLLWPVVVLAAIPLGVSYFKYEDHLPKGFGEFPPQLIEVAPQYSPLYAGIIAVLAALIVLVYLFPKIVGIKGNDPNIVLPQPSSASFPWWFYAGGSVMLVSWWLMWARPESLMSIVPYAFSPLWWGFIVWLDGIVYKRNGGASFLSEKPGLMLVCALVSLVGWCFFEYFDYFVMESWYYPQVDVLPHELTVLVFLVAYTTVWPAVFVWYNLINTFPNFVARYNNGPKCEVNGLRMLIIGFLLMAGMTQWPYLLFWGVWVGPTVAFIGLLKMYNIKSPVDDLAVGNWAPILLIMLACITNGLVWEFWNYGSSNPVDPISNPNYWKYNVPYVNIPWIHIPSEMPLLGYFGYMPFGILVWQFYIWAGELCGFDSDITVSKSQ